MAVNTWFDPGNSYGGTPGWDQTPFVQQYLDPQIPRGVYTNYLSEQGFGGQDRRSLWGQSRGTYLNTEYGYESALRQNPTLTYNDYLGLQFGNGGLQNTWLGMSPTQRGEQPNLYQPQTRVIAWG